MSKDLDQLMKQRQEDGEATTERFFSVLRGEGLVEEFFEIRFRNGVQTCFSYKDLTWFNYSPDEGLIDVEFSGFLVTIKGRGLVPKLFEAIKSKRVAWVREADDGLHDSKELDHFVGSILVTPPEGFGDEEDEEAA